MTGQKNCPVKPVPLLLCDQQLPWVERCDHLGHILTTTASMNADCKTKRADFIDKAVKTREFFNFAHPEEVITATEKYNTSFYGHNLWDLRNETSEMVFSSWRTNVKLIWGLPRNTKNYFVDKLLASQVTPPKVSLLAQCHNFFHALLDSNSDELRIVVRLAAHDLRSNIGRNLDAIRQETGLDPWSFGNARIKDELRNFHESSVPEQDEWKIGYARKLLSQRQIAFYHGNKEIFDYTNELLHSLVTS